jgi:hypothetical protein
VIAHENVLVLILALEIGGAGIDNDERELTDFRGLSPDTCRKL